MPVGWRLGKWVVALLLFAYILDSWVIGPYRESAERATRANRGLHVTTPPSPPATPTPVRPVAVPSTAPPTPPPPVKDRRRLNFSTYRHPRWAGKRGEWALSFPDSSAQLVRESVGRGEFRETYLIPEREFKDHYKKIKADHPFLVKDLKVIEQYAVLRNPTYALYHLKKVKWNKDGTRRKPVKQKEPFFPEMSTMETPTYDWPDPHRCPGSPYECSGRGVCETIDGKMTGRCICHPPWTGWNCSMEMMNLYGGDTEALNRAIDRANKEPRNAQSQYMVVGDGKVRGGWCNSTDAPPGNGHWDQRGRECADKNKNAMWGAISQDKVVGMGRGWTSLLGMVEKGSLFSVGTGCGNLLREAMNEWPHATMGGVDLSTPGLQHCRKTMPNGVFCNTNIVQMADVPTESYDFAWTHGVLWYVWKDSQCKVIRDMVRIIKPGGTAVVADVLDPQHKIGCYHNGVDSYGGVFIQVSVDELQGCLAGMGLKIDYFNMYQASGRTYTQYCADEMSLALITKVI